MSSSVAALFPGVDLCTLASGAPPEGQVSNFNNPASSVKNLVIIFTVIPTVLAVVFSFGRLWANFKRRNWGDYLVLLAVLIIVAQTVLLITFVKYYRHLWDIPLCWINSQLMQLSYTYEMMTSIGLFLAKTATLLLFHQLFQISRQMRFAIRAGIVANAILYGTSIAAFSYRSAPHAGQTWDDLVSAVAVNTDFFVLKWGIGQAAVGAALDIYIFILPLPAIARLNLSTRKKIQLTAVFLTAILGIVASLVSLAYRVETLSDTRDSTWNTGYLMICNQVELAVAIMVSSMPAFASFVRNSLLESKLVSSIRSLLGSRARNGTRGPSQKSADSNPNKPRTGNDPRARGQKTGYYELNETWLMNSRVTVDIEHQPNHLQPAYEGRGIRVNSSVNMEELPSAVNQESGRGLVFH